MPEKTRTVGFCGSCMGCPWVSARVMAWPPRGGKGRRRRPNLGRTGGWMALQEAAQLATIDDAEPEDRDNVYEQTGCDQYAKSPETDHDATGQGERRREPCSKCPQRRAHDQGGNCNSRQRAKEPRITHELAPARQ